MDYLNLLITLKIYLKLKDLKDAANFEEIERINLLQALGYCLMQLHDGKFDKLLPSEIALLENFFPKATSDWRLNKEKDYRADFRSLTNLYCFILTNGEITEYSKNLAEEDLKCSCPYEALDIITKMDEGSITIGDVLRHPFYWSDEQKVLFICKSYDHITADITKTDRHSEATKKEILNGYNMADLGDVCTEDGWIIELRLTQNEVGRIQTKSEQFSKIQDCIYALARKKTESVNDKNGRSLYELLRFFRHRYFHHYDDTEPVRACFESYPTGYWKFFSSRFPKLLTHVYNNMNHYFTPENIKRPSAEELVGKLSKHFHFAFTSKPEAGFLTDPEGWIAVKGTNIKYNPKKRLRPGSKVFEAVKEGIPEDKIVIKFITEFVEKNEREVHLLKLAGNSKHVVNYIESGFRDFHGEKAIYIAMEQCETKTLSERIDQDCIPYKIRKNYVHCIAKGLQHLKTNNIMHRDLKPQNILFRDGSPVISDFGLSKKHPTDKSRTAQSMAVGTDGWRAPETSKEDCKTSYETDMYSAGLMFHFTLTDGMHPYSDGTNRAHWQTLIDLDKDGTKCNLNDIYNTPDGPIAFDLIEWMLRRVPQERPTIEEVLKHPFFFSAKKWIEFLSRAHLAIYDADTPLNLDQFTTEKYGKKVADETKNWKDKKLELTEGEMAIVKNNFAEKGVQLKVEKDAMIKKAKAAKKAKNTVAGLLKFIRDRHAHCFEDEDKEIFFLTDEQFIKFYFDRFPNFFIYVFHRFKNYNIHEDKQLPGTMAEYF